MPQGMYHPNLHQQVQAVQQTNSPVSAADMSRSSNAGQQQGMTPSPNQQQRVRDFSPGQQQQQTHQSQPSAAHIREQQQQQQQQHFHRNSPMELTSEAIHRSGVAAAHSGRYIPLKTMPVNHPQQPQPAHSQPSQNSPRDLSSQHQQQQPSQQSLMNLYHMSTSAATAQAPTVTNQESAISSKSDSIGRAVPQRPPVAHVPYKLDTMRKNKDQFLEQQNLQAERSIPFSQQQQHQTSMSEPVNSVTTSSATSNTEQFSRPNMTQPQQQPSSQSGQQHRPPPRRPAIVPFKMDAMRKAQQQKKAAAEEAAAAASSSQQSTEPNHTQNPQQTAAANLPSDKPPPHPVNRPRVSSTVPFKTASLKSSKLPSSISEGRPAVSKVVPFKAAAMRKHNLPPPPAPADDDGDDDSSSSSSGSSSSSSSSSSGQ